ncbi:MAG: 50S ribosomal protein L24, large subunit ribosomal protein L24 [Candidatus Peregrinibacteria bacterium GW2011_GWE2_39_6]|nr:MAG: 50S ribosomal protein L24, large subunit ribosomal protein L24 [Candidatus Peregrinibacteria bacterium GW2011_GWF2_39_17]KKR26544.1 MAG: 50S ribosomal protein L24, large subunit ribosomal protein L24 [Candidatus Peregrinibacteria bacterium GW2011_GWE2_39_6]
MKIKTGDTVLIISGKNKNAKNKVMRVLQKQQRIVVEKVNIRKKHIKKTSAKAGEIISYEAPIHVSNVKVVCPNCNKPARVGYTFLADKKKQRICKKCQQSLDQTPSKKK